MKRLKQLTVMMGLSLLIGSLTFNCEGPAGEDGIDGVDGTDGIDGVDGTDGENGEDFTPELLTPLAQSEVPNTVFKMHNDFTLDQVSIILSSKDILPSDPSFVYGSLTDGSAIFPNEDDTTFTFIVNLESDYSIARIQMNKDLQPLTGEYIVNSEATSGTAQCSGSSITIDEHGFGPLYLSGGEWDGTAQGVFMTDPFKDAYDAMYAERLPALGEWETENAVVIGKDAYADKTVVFMGDDDSDNSYPDGHFGMYVGARGDLTTGDLYVLRGKNPTESALGQGGQLFEMGMAENTSYDVEWVKVTERTKNELNEEAKSLNAIGFQRIEDIDWKRGDASDQRTLFFCVTGRYASSNPAMNDRGTKFGRVYMLELNENDPTADAKLTCILDGDNPNGQAYGFHSPDNILVTENYAYIQEDPNGYFNQNASIQGWAKLYQYDIENKTLKTVLECNQSAAENERYGGESSTWEITGLIDVTDVIGADEPTFVGGVQVHGWDYANKPLSAIRADGRKFFDATAISEGSARMEGSFLFKITGLPR